MNETLHFQVDENSRKLRLDEFLEAKISGVSKMYLRDLIKTEKCLVNGSVENRGYKLRSNDFVEIELDYRVELVMKPEPLPLEIVFEDAEIIVVNKASGMLMHPTFAQKTGTLLNALAFYLNRSQESSVESREKEIANSQLSTPDSRPFVRPGLVHRLDRQTSGLLVVAKTLRAHRILSDHFRRKLVEKNISLWLKAWLEKIRALSTRRLDASKKSNCGTSRRTANTPKRGFGSKKDFPIRLYWNSNP